jgi:hypothetical protein
MTTATVIQSSRRRRPIVGERVELARYTITAETRVLFGQRVDGVVRVVDRPLSGEGRSYLVERDVEQDGNDALKALVRDYIQQSRVHDQVPMLTSNFRPHPTHSDADEEQG